MQAHPFFKGVAWTRNSSTPYQPRITHETDTSNFADDAMRPGRPQPAPHHGAEPSYDEFSDFNWQRFWDGGRTASASSGPGHTTSYGSSSKA